MRTVQVGPAIGLAGQLALLSVLAGTAGLSLAGWLVGTGCGLITTAMLSYGLSRSGTAVLGAANRVTLTRAALVGGVAALVVDGLVRPASVTTLVGLAVVALVLDGVDGWVARRTRTVSALGARFDMEVDAFLLLVLSVYVGRSVGLWVLAIGAARYVAWAAGSLVPWMGVTVPPRYWRKPVAAIQGIVLTAAVVHLLPAPAMIAAIAVALLLLAESFGRDVVWQWRQRRTSTTPEPPDMSAWVVALATTQADKSETGRLVVAGSE
jgi:phosphatidylglycerophosphate synthase